MIYCTIKYSRKGIPARTHELGPFTDATQADKAATQFVLPLIHEGYVTYTKIYETNTR